MHDATNICIVKNASVFNETESMKQLSKTQNTNRQHSKEIVPKSIFSSKFSLLLLLFQQVLFESIEFSYSSQIFSIIESIDSVALTPSADRSRWHQNEIYSINSGRQFASAFEKFQIHLFVISINSFIVLFTSHFCVSNKLIVVSFY